jgi:hypothetical protein
MLLNRVKVIALCAGGWVLVAAAHTACSELTLPDNKCHTIATNSNWIDRVGQIKVDITEPRWCPVIIYGAPGSIGFQNYTANVEVNAAYLAASRRMDYTIENANHVVQKTFITSLSGSPLAVTQTHGTYDVGTAGNVTTKRDYVRNVIYTTAGPATGDAYLDYNYKANPGLSGATSSANGLIRLTANTPLVQQPVTYQWWLSNVLQGPPSGSSNYYQIWGKTVANPGVYNVKVVVVDKQGFSYTMTKSVTVTAGYCGGKIC